MLFEQAAEVDAVAARVDEGIEFGLRRDREHWAFDAVAFNLSALTMLSVLAGPWKSTSATELPNTSCIQRTLPGGDKVSSAETRRKSWLSRGRSISRCWPKITGRA